MSYVSRLIGILVILSLSACGGGGGGGKAPSITLRAGAEPIQRHAMQVLDTTNLTLDQSTYTAFIDGQETLLGAGMDGELILVLPAGLSAGNHELRITLEGRDFVIPFTVAAAVIAPVEDSLAVIEQIFTDARLAIDTQIDILIGLDADQSIIDDLLAKRALLDTGSNDFQALSADELDYLSKLLSNLLADEAAAQRALITLPPGCNAPEYIRKFVRFAAGAAVTGIVAANVSVFGTPILGAIVGGVLLADTLSRIRPLADEFVELWPKCIKPITSKITMPTASKSSVRSAATRSTIFNIEDGVMEFVVDIPEIYEMESEFDVFKGLYDHFPDIRRFISDFSFVIPDSVEDYILERTSDDYAEAVDPANIILMDISEPNVTGEINAVDDRRFSITFFVDGPFEGSPVFEFVLHNTLHDVQTQYTANLSLPEHCPTLLPEGYYAAIKDKTCYVIYPSGADVQYWEYRYRLQIRFERYENGGSSLLAMKGLGSTDLPDVGVGMLRDVYRHSLFFSGDTFHAPLDVAESYQNGGLKVVTQYSAPFKGADGVWHAVAESMIEYFNGVKTREQQYSDALLNGFFGDNAEYVSVLASDRVWVEGVLQYTESYSAPYFDNDWNQWRSYRTRYDDHVGNCYYLFNSEGNTTFENCSQEETP